MSNSKPAILGGHRSFKDGLSLCRPSMPPLSSLISGLEEILASGVVTKGKYLRSFEEAVADHCRVKEAVALSSCTTGLVLLPGLLGLTGEVILPSFTFMASTLAAAWNNITPVFVDVDPHTWNINPVKVEEAITDRTTAIISTHVFGNPADVKTLTEIAHNHGVEIVFDAAHGFGAQHEGSPVGSSGRCEVFSCSPTKLVVCGEGGVVTTNDEDLACRLRRAREYGNMGDYNLAFPGLNGRMPEISALLGLRSLEMLDGVSSSRNQLSTLLRDLLSSVPGLSWQKIDTGNQSSYKDLVVRIDAESFGLTRDELVVALAREGVETRNYYDPPCHLQEHWKDRAKVGPSGLSVTEQLSASVVSLPLHSEMSHCDMERLAEVIIRTHKFSPEIKTFLPDQLLSVS
jgi:dTDP-4-amino-4,6-dideoxygalactose transaminase